MNKKTLKIIRDYLLITFGSAIMGLGIGVFLIDAHVVPGGVSGLSMAIYYLTNHQIPVGLLMWVFNIPLFIWGIKELGKSFALRTFYAFSISSFFIDFFRGDFIGFSFIKLQKLDSIVDLAKNDFLFTVLIGAVLLGLGLGIIFKFKGTTAGSDIVAAIMNKRYGIKTGQAIMITDFFIIVLAGFIIEFKGIEVQRPALTLTLYAIFLLFISSKLIDAIIDGFDYARVAYVISNKSDEISEMVLNDIGRGATAFKTRGLYTNTDREVIMTVVPVKVVGELTEKVKEIDPEAFVILNNVHEVLGKGFNRRF